MDDSFPITNHSLIIAVQSPISSEFNEAYERFCDTYMHKVYSWCRRQLGDNELAEDAVQELFMNLRERLSKYRPQPGVRFRAWLQRVSRNLAEDVRRRERMHKKISGNLDTETDAGFDIPDRDADFAMKIVLENELRGILEQVRSELSDVERELLICKFEELAAVEIAERLCVTVVNVGTRWFRLRLKLQALLRSRGVSAWFDELLPD